MRSHLHGIERLACLRSVALLINLTTHVVERCPPLLKIRPPGESFLHRRDPVQRTNVNRRLKVRRKIPLFNQFLELSNIQLELSSTARRKQDPKFDVREVGVVERFVVLRKLD